MKLLLDTHVAIWWFTGDRKIGLGVRQAIDQAAAVYVSSISCAEAAIKTAVGKLRLPTTLSDGVSLAGFSSLPLTAQHAEVLATLPLHHRDPFDRLLIAQAIIEELTVATSESMFLAYPIKVLVV